MSRQPPLILSLDIGTSSARALLFDGCGRRIDEIGAQERYTLRTSDDGATEVDPDQLLRATFRCIDHALQRLADVDAAAQVDAVGVSTFVGNLLGVDRKDRPTTPLLTYADTRSAPQVAQLRQRIDGDAVHQRTGCRLHTSYWPGQLCWIGETRPEWAARTVQWITLGDYLQRIVLGSPGVSHSVAAWTGLLNRHTLSWNDQLLELLPAQRSQLAPIIDLDALDTGLKPDWAKRWPALAKARWLAAVGDGAAANIGSDCATPNRVALTVGTTSAMRTVSGQTVTRVPDGLWCYRVDRPRALIGGALTEGGNLFAWARRTMSLPRRLNDVEQIIGRMEPDSHGLTFLPLLGGERAPGWRGDLRGSLHGLTLATEPEEILRAGLEGVALRIGLVYARLLPMLAPDAAVIASGGALLHSPAWLQIMADVLGCPVQPSPVGEASARGVAMLALAALGIDAPALPFEQAAHQPNQEAHLRYQAATQRQSALYAWMAEQ